MTAFLHYHQRLPYSYWNNALTYACMFCVPNADDVDMEVFQVACSKLSSNATHKKPWKYKTTKSVKDFDELLTKEFVADQVHTFGNIKDAVDTVLAARAKAACKTGALSRQFSTRQMMELFPQIPHWVHKGKEHQPLDVVNFRQISCGKIATDPETHNLGSWWGRIVV